MSHEETEPTDLVITLTRQDAEHIYNLLQQERHKSLLYTKGGYDQDVHYLNWPQVEETAIRIMNILERSGL